MSEIKNAEEPKKFDLAKFNKEFVFKKEEAKVQNRIKSQAKIDRLTELVNIEKKPLYSYSVSEMIIGIKDTWFGILDDVLAQRIELKTITKRDRLFFMGLTFIIICAVLYSYNFFLEDDDKTESKSTPQIIEKHYIYQNNNTGSSNQPGSLVPETNIISTKDIKPIHQPTSPNTSINITPVSSSLS